MTNQYAHQPTLARTEIPLGSNGAPILALPSDYTVIYYNGMIQTYGA